MSSKPSEDTSFSTDITGLEEAALPTVVHLDDGDELDLRISSVVKQIGAARVRMLTYNGSVPGPTLRVRQGSEISVRVRNEGDVETTVHWHGLRLENQYDGVPHETQAPIEIGGEFIYRLRFPDEGLYWYHPHSREDYGLELGLYGNLLVDPAEPKYWAPADREFVVTLDDVLIEDGRIAPFSHDGPTHVAMGRFGNVMLTAGQADLRLEAHAGEVVRLYLTNTANTRLFNVTVPGARMKLVGGDSGRYEHETFVDTVLLSPSERAIVDVLLPTTGSYSLEHRTPDRSYVLGTITVAGEQSDHSAADAFGELRMSAALVSERARISADLDRPPDKTLAFVSRMPLLYPAEEVIAASWTCPMHPEIVESQAGTCPVCGMKLGPKEADDAPAAWTCPMHPDVVRDQRGTCPQCGMSLVPALSAASPVVWTCPMHPDVRQGEPGACPQCGMKLIVDSAAAPAEMPEDHDGAGHGDAHTHGHEHESGDGLEWEDLMPEINRASDPTNMIWQLVDLDTGKANWEIDWAFRVGDRVKIRLVNDMNQDHPMHHPFHIHGAGRFLVLARDDQTETNLVWKDTVLVRSGETVDLLLDVSNAGRWMAHCHIAEHNQSGMMFSFPVSSV